MNTHTDTEAHNSFSGILNSEEYFPFLRKISRKKIFWKISEEIFSGKPSLSVTDLNLVCIFVSEHTSSAFTARTVVCHLRRGRVAGGP